MSLGDPVYVDPQRLIINIVSTVVELRNVRHHLYRPFSTNLLACQQYFSSSNEASASYQPPLLCL